MTRALLMGGIWVLAVVTLFFVGSLLYEWDALDRDRDGWRAPAERSPER